MRAVLVPVKGLPQIVNIDGSLRSLQKLVGGSIEPVVWRKGYMAWANEEGLIHGLPYNDGPVVITRKSQAHSGLSDRDIDYVMMELGTPMAFGTEKVIVHHGSKLGASLPDVPDDGNVHIIGGTAFVNRPPPGELSPSALRAKPKAEQIININIEGKRTPVRIIIRPDGVYAAGVQKKVGRTWVNIIGTGNTREAALHQMLAQYAIRFESR